MEQAITIADLLVTWGNHKRVHIRCTPSAHSTACGRWIPGKSKNGSDVTGSANRCAVCFRASTR
jgi:hypothetical protein